MIHPLLPYAIKGAIWYQGESNAGRAYQYRTLFPTMIESWREAWKNPDMPFLFVQLAPFGNIVKEPQRQRLGGTARGATADQREAQKYGAWPSSPTWARRTTFIPSTRSRSAPVWPWPPWPWLTARKSSIPARSTTG